MLICIKAYHRINGDYWVCIEQFIIVHSLQCNVWKPYLVVYTMYSTYMHISAFTINSSIVYSIFTKHWQLHKKGCKISVI